MIYIDYLGQHGAFTSTLEGEDWKITSVTEHQISQENFEYNSFLSTMTHLIFTIEITNEFGKSIKFDVDSGITIDGQNPSCDDGYIYGESRELNFVHLNIGSNKRLVIIRSEDEDCSTTLDNKLTKFLKNEMKFVRDYFDKAETVALKKQDIEKDFDK